MKETMTSRERWMAVLSGQKPDRIPLDFSAVSEVPVKILRETGLSDMEAFFEKYHVDYLEYVEPKFTGVPRVPGASPFGVTFREVQYENGKYRETDGHPLEGYESLDEIIENYSFPDPDDFDFSCIKDQLKGKERRPTAYHAARIFSLMRSLRGDIQSYIDLIEEPEIVKYLSDKATDFFCEMIVRTFESAPKGSLDIIRISEDMGGMNGLLFRREIFLDMFWSNIKRMCDCIHSCGAKVFLHSCGAIYDVIGDFVSAGADILDPIQWKCGGMQRERLKAEFGDKIAFHGSMDNQHTMVFASPDEVRAEVRDNIRLLGPRLVLTSCHTLQVASPVENIIAMYEEGYSSGWL